MRSGLVAHPNRANMAIAQLLLEGDTHARALAAGPRARGLMVAARQTESWKHTYIICRGCSRCSPSRTHRTLHLAGIASSFENARSTAADHQLTDGARRARNVAALEK